MMKEEKDRIAQAEFERILGELTQRAYAGQLLGLAVASITDGGFGTQCAHIDKQKGPLLAAVTLLQHDIIQSFEMREAPPLDGAEPPPERLDGQLGQRVVGVGRILGETRAVEVCLGREVSDDDIRALHDFLHGWRR
jgi:hypothetical protein